MYILMSSTSSIAWYSIELRVSGCLPALYHIEQREPPSCASPQQPRHPLLNMVSSRMPGVHFPKIDRVSSKGNPMLPLSMLKALSPCSIRYGAKSQPEPLSLSKAPPPCSIRPYLYPWLLGAWYSIEWGAGGGHPLSLLMAPPPCLILNGVGRQPLPLSLPKAPPPLIPILRRISAFGPTPLAWYRIKQGAPFAPTCLLELAP